MGGSGGGTSSDVQLAKQRAAKPPGHHGGRRDKVMWLIAADIGCALAAGLVPYVHETNNVRVRRRCHRPEVRRRRHR